MTKYIVKKEFYSPGGMHYEVGYGKINELDWSDTFNASLIADGFVEEVKEDTRWRPAERGTYYTVLANSHIHTARYYKPGGSAFNIGNGFKSRETAEKVAEALKLFFALLHTPETNDAKELGSINKTMAAQRTAHLAVLADDKRGGDE